jgi:hypothetical protein
MAAGAKGKYCPEIVKKIADCIAQGNYANVACALAGIADCTYYAWLADESKPEFSDAIKEAEALAEATAVAAIQNDPSWQSKAWYLERKFKDRWSKSETQNVNHNGEGLNITVSFPEKKDA